MGWVQLTLVSKRGVGGHRVHEDPKQGQGGEKTPTELPVDADGDVQHELDVLDELLQAVDPGNANSLHHGKEEYDESSTKEINETKNGLPSRGDIKEADAKAEKADDPGDQGLVPEWVDVADDSNDSAGEAGGWAKPKGDQHEEEKNRKELGQEVKLSEGTWVADKGESRSRINNVLHRDLELEGKVTKNGEDDEASKERGEGVGHADDEGVPVRVVPEVVVGGISDEGSEAGGEGEERLSYSGIPHLQNTHTNFLVQQSSHFVDLEIEQLWPLWCDVEPDSLHGTRQGQAPNQEGDQNHIREYGSEVGNLCRKYWSQILIEVKTLPLLATPFHMVRKRSTQHPARQRASSRSGTPKPFVKSASSFNTPLLKYCSAELMIVRFVSPVLLLLPPATHNLGDHNHWLLIRIELMRNKFDWWIPPLLRQIQMTHRPW